MHFSTKLHTQVSSLSNIEAEARRGSRHKRVKKSSNFDQSSFENDIFLDDVAAIKNFEINKFKMNPKRFYLKRAMLDPRVRINIGNLNFKSFKPPHSNKDWLKVKPAILKKKEKKVKYYHTYPWKKEKFKTYKYPLKRQAVDNKLKILKSFKENKNKKMNKKRKIFEKERILIQNKHKNLKNSSFHKLKPSRFESSNRKLLKTHIYTTQKPTIVKKDRLISRNNYF